MTAAFFAVRSLRCRALAFAAALLAAACPCQQIPPTALTTLDGVDDTLPSPQDTRPLLLVLSFSHAAAADVKAWGKIAQQVHAIDSSFRRYEIADLESAPSFLRGMIVRSMRQSIEPPERAHFAIITTQTAAWKSLVGFSDPNVAYLVLADGSGHVLWQARGPATADGAAALRAQLARLQPQQP